MPDKLAPSPYRNKPYSMATISRMACSHCGTAPAAQEWTMTVCANKRRRIHSPLCDPCDAAFNRHSLEYINHPDVDALMAEYGDAQ